MGYDLKPGSLRTAALVAIATLTACAGTERAQGRRQAALVDITDRIPDIALDIRYAQSDNFLGRAMYSAARCLLIPEAAERLKQAETALRRQGFRLVVWDCYRPRSVQFAMWEIVPDPRYVADPVRGSRHNRGAAVDVGLLTLAGEPVPLPTEHDDFTEAAHREAIDLPADAIASREQLQRAMIDAGWQPLDSEWWHFDAPGWEEHPLRDDPL